MINVLLVGCGGFVGAVLRYLVSLKVQQALGPGFPWGTFFVNITGCLLIGLLSGLFVARAFHPSAGLLMITGVLGGFTTFSAFGLETLNLLSGGRIGTACAYAFASLAVGLFAVWLGRYPFAG
ncbi:MAG TPA: fluoride efflux transporter CrcB [Opitutales bacterium]|nr:fluoride efflux transporter CrcB [Opitutales bacterium]